MNRTNKLFYYLLLLIFPVAFLLHNVNENFGLIPLTDLAALLFQYLFVTLFIAILSVIIIKEQAKSTVFSFALLLIYFGFGAFKDIAKQHHLRALLTSYKVLLPSLLVAVCLLAFYLKTTRSSLQRPVNMITLFLLVNLVVETGWCGYNAITRADLKQDFGDFYHVQIRNYQPQNAAQKPDVFWLIFDEYAASSTLKKVWQFSNPLDATLQAKGFFVAGNARSNYNFTPYSITSMLDMTYLNGLHNHAIVTARDMAKGAYSLFDNNVIRVFEKTGYRVKNYSIFNFNHHPTNGMTLLGYVPRLLVNFQTMGGRIQQDIGWNFSNIFSTNRVKANALDEADALREIDKNYDAFLSKCFTEIRLGAEQQPVCCIFHFMIPHEPFIYNADGTLAFSNGLNALQKNYLSQVKYTNAVINAVTDSILKNNHNKNIVIIIQGDHGYKFDDTDPLYDAESCKTFYAVYCSDKNYTAWNNDITVVNSFRILFNKYFNAHFRLLPDTTYNLYYR